ncbi:DUF1877 family protein [Kitasatospora sp. NPDC004614]|uniref:DUF1877 family protein n=1 Tax=unclassified Kitasatospora TaxID=2633591 RepID=UPI0036B1FB06
MAITQQLARITPDHLERCRRHAALHDGDPDWDPPAGDHLDLDWSPVALRAVCERAGLDRTQVDALRRALDGSAAVDLGVLNTWPHPIAFVGPATALTPAEVAGVAAELAEIDFPALLDRLPSGPTLAALLGFDLDGDPARYLLRHFHALQAFYAGAARRGLMTVLWWD